MGSWQLCSRFLNPAKTTRAVYRYSLDDHHFITVKLHLHRGCFMVKSTVTMMNVHRDTYITSELLAIEDIESLLTDSFSVRDVYYYCVASTFQVSVQPEEDAPLICVSVTLPEYSGGQIPKHRHRTNVRRRRSMRRVKSWPRTQQTDIVTCTNVIVNKGLVALLPMSPLELSVYVYDQFDSWKIKPCCEFRSNTLTTDISTV